MWCVVLATYCRCHFLHRLLDYGENPPIYSPHALLFAVFTVWLPHPHPHHHHSKQQIGCERFSSIFLSFWSICQMRELCKYHHWCHTYSLKKSITYAPYLLYVAVYFFFQLQTKCLNYIMKKTLIWCQSLKIHYNLLDKNTFSFILWLQETNGKCYRGRTQRCKLQEETATTWFFLHKLSN